MAIRFDHNPEWEWWEHHAHLYSWDPDEINRLKEKICAEIQRNAARYPRVIISVKLDCSKDLKSGITTSPYLKIETYEPNDQNLSRDKFERRLGNLLDFLSAQALDSAPLTKADPNFISPFQPGVRVLFTGGAHHLEEAVILRILGGPRERFQIRFDNGDIIDTEPIFLEIMQP